jgi:4-amino-4-deoxy-L-arabinose transferase-like glycosyltransferase
VRFAGIAILVATLILVVAVRLRVADAPLERDEGEYAYAGQLILQGIPPYGMAYNMKFPGTYYAYAAIMGVLGESPRAIRIGLIAVHVATVVLLFLLGRRLLGTFAASIGASSFALLGLDRWSMGVFAHATHFVLLPAVAGLVVLHQAIRTGQGWQFIAAGALTGLAVLMKQQAIAVAALAIVWTVLAAWRTPGSTRVSVLQRTGLVAAGLAAPFAIVCGVLAWQGVLGRFWFWTFQYAAAYVSETPLSAADDMLVMAWGYITRANWMLWYAAAVGLALLFVQRWTREARAVLGGWLLASALAILPGFFFRPHYFILLMPIAGLLVGVAIASLDGWLSRRMAPATARSVALAVFVAIAAAYVNTERDYFFRMTTHDLMRSVYESNPFPEAVEIGRYIQAHSTPDDRIVVVGSEPEIYFYANRRSATGYIYTYALMERQPYASGMQDEMIREVEAARPAYLVFVGVASSWATTPASDTRILNWANQYTAQCYERVGVSDIDPIRGTTTRWDAESLSYEPRSTFVVLTFRRKQTCASLR